MKRICPRGKPRVFYGYWITLASFVLNVIQSGCGFFAFSLFVRPLQIDLGWSRGDIMAGWTVYYMLIAVSSPFIGRLVDRYGARKVIVTGAVIGSVGFVLLSQINSLWQFYLSYAVVGIGLAGIGYVPTSAVVSNWFRRRRGMAIGIMSVGLGAGGIVLAPLVAGYLIPNFGWQISYLSLAVITSVFVIPLTLFVIRTDPADMGLHPDGIETPSVVTTTGSSSPVSHGLTLKAVLSTSALWLIAVSFLISAFSNTGIIQNQVPHLQDVGFPITVAATALGALSVMSAIGKFFFGWLCDRIQAKHACTIGLILQVAAIVVMISIGPASSLEMVWLYAIMMGLGVGSWLPTVSMLTSTSFGLASYGAVFGMVVLALGIGTATGPLFAGNLYDTMNTYHWAFVAFLCLYAVSIPTVLAVRQPKSLRI